MTQTSWSTWAVPAEYVQTYLFVMFMSMYIVTQICIWIEFYHTGLVIKFVMV
jgi:hypothetical protein